MGVGGEKKPMREIDDTRAATAIHQFESIIEKVKEKGGTIVKDETYPLYIEVGMEEDEVGEERTVEFNLHSIDFQLIRKTETHRLQGAGRQKSLEELTPPRVNLSLKRKPELSDNWQSVDLEDMF